MIQQQLPPKRLLLHIKFYLLSFILHTMQIFGLRYRVNTFKKNFFNDTATTEIYTLRYTLSLHDALPISAARIASASRP